MRWTTLRALPVVHGNMTAKELHRLSCRSQIMHTAHNDETCVDVALGRPPASPNSPRAALGAHSITLSPPRGAEQRVKAGCKTVVTAATARSARAQKGGSTSAQGRMQRACATPQTRRHMRHRKQTGPGRSRRRRRWTALQARHWTSRPASRKRCTPTAHPAALVKLDTPTAQVGTATRLG